MKKMLAFQSGEFIRVNRLARAIQRDDDGESDGDFSCGDGDNEKHQHLSMYIRQAVGTRIKARKSNQGEVGRAEHKLQAHEHDDDIAAHDDTGEPDGEKKTGNDQVVVECGHGMRKLV